MKLHYMGRFSGDTSTLPHGEHKPGAVPFREIQDPQKLALAANGIALALLVVLLAAGAVRGGAYSCLAGCWPWPFCSLMNCSTRSVFAATYTCTPTGGRACSLSPGRRICPGGGSF